MLLDVFLLNTSLFFLSNIRLLVFYFVFLFEKDINSYPLEFM